MTTDNRSEISDCDSDSGNWSGATTPVDNSDIYYQGAGSIEVQATNSYRGWWRDAATSWNLTSVTLYFIVKPNNPDTEANGGVRIHLGDGTDARAYYIGGSDNLGFPIPGGWSVYRLDTDNLPASYSQPQGSAEPDLTAITECGVGVLSATKAIGNVVNTFFDRISYIANGSPAFTVDGGTVGTPEAFSDLVGDDVTNGWGFFNNPIAGSKQYGIYGAIEWGDDGTGDSYFDDSDAQVYLIGTGLSANTMDQDLISNSTGTNSFVLTNVVMVHVGEPANWNFDSANFDIQKLNGCQFVDSGTIALHSTNHATDRYVDNTLFIGCEQIDINKTEINGCTFAETADVDAAILWDDSEDIQSCTFRDNTTGAAIEMPSSAGTPYGYDALLFPGNTNDVLNSSGSAIEINKNNGSDPTSYEGSTVTFLGSAVTVKVHAQLKNGDDYQNARVFLPAKDGTGPFPFQETVTISNSGTTATVTHTDHDMANNDYVNIDLSASGSEKTHYQNDGTFQITYIDVDSYSYTMLSAPGSSPTGTIKATFVGLFGLTDVNGDISTSRLYPSDQPLKGWVRDTPAYKSFPLDDVVDDVDGLTLTAVLFED